MATRYWVGTATTDLWNSTANWSTSSGGPSGASVPTATDDVVFDANSLSQTILMTGTPICANLTITPIPTGGTGNYRFFSLSQTFTVTGTFSMSGTAGNTRTVIGNTLYCFDFNVNAVSNISDVDFINVRVTGAAAPISGTRLGDLANNLGITFDSPKTVYWVTAASGNWEDNNWSNSSGGSANTNYYPLAQDIAVIDDNGLSATNTINFTGVDVYPAIGAFDMSPRTISAYFNFNAAYFYGDLTLGSSVNFFGNYVYFVGQKNQTIKSNSSNILCSYLVINSYNGTVYLADNLNTTADLIFYEGTFNTQSYSVAASSISTWSIGVQKLVFGSSTITLSSTQPFVCNVSDQNFCTINAGTSTIICNSSNITLFSAENQTLNNLYFTSLSLSQSCILSTNFTVNNLTISAASSYVGVSEIIIYSGFTANTFTCNAPAENSRFILKSNTSGTSRTLTVGSFSSTNCDFRDIAIVGSSSVTGAGDCGGNSGITFPSSKTVYWNLAGAKNWSDNGWCSSSGGTPNTNQFPLAQDTAVFNNAGSITQITVDGAFSIGSVDMSTRTSAMTFNASTSTNYYGDWKFGTGVTSASNTTSQTFSKRGTQTITSNGVTFNNFIVANTVNGIVQIADAIVVNSTKSLTVFSGTFDAVSYNVTTGVVTTTNSILKMGSGTWTLSGVGSVWTLSSSQFYKNTANIVLSDTSTTARTFAGGSLSYNKLTIGGSSGTSTLTITGNNQFTELASTKTVAHTIAFGTTSQTFGAWTVTGTVGNVVTITGTATITIAGARVSGVDYLALGTITISATSPGEFYAGANSTGGTNTILTAAPAAVTRYWRGGSGTWTATSTTNWSATSGGTGGASVPTSADTVIFDAASNATLYTVTCTATQLRCASITFSAPGTSGNVTWAGTAPLAIHGNLTLPSTRLTRTYAGVLTFSGSATGKTITTNGVTFGSGITINGIGCGFTFGSALTTTSSFTLTNGAVDTGGFAVSSASFSGSNSNTKSLTLGASTWSLTSAFSINTNNLTFSKGTSTFSITSSTHSFTVTDATGSSNAAFDINNISFTSSAAKTITINAALTANTFSFAGNASGVGSIVFGANQSFTTLTLSANTNAICRTVLRSSTLGSTCTLTVATFTAGATDYDFRDITITGAAAPISGTRFGNLKGNSGITFSAGTNKYWNLAAGGNWNATAWATSSGGTPAVNNFPLVQDTAIFDATGLNSGATVTINVIDIGSIDMSARTTNTITLASGTTDKTIYGNWINGTGTTLTGTSTFTWAGRTSQTITSASVTFTQPFTINTAGGSVTLQDAFVSSSSTTFALYFVAGTFDANNYNVTLTSASSAVRNYGSGTRTIAFGSGTWAISGTFLSAGATNFTITGTGTISFTKGTTKVVELLGDWSGITVNQGGLGMLQLTEKGTYKNITNTFKSILATTIYIGSTYVTCSQFSAAGESGRLLTLQGTGYGRFIFTGTTAPDLDYLNATQLYVSNTNNIGNWYAGDNSINNGSLGLLFQSKPAASNGFFFMFN